MNLEFAVIGYAVKCLAIQNVKACINQCQVCREFIQNRTGSLVSLSIYI